ncbi:MAG: tyrosine-type recombinase/integrase, partial [Dehalococcoidia bacterium]|nr:tyrosine-type recombinase/integrase [Dehalococcoidia bacterium]
SIAPFEDIADWESALYAFLAEKERRSGSRRTVEGYARMLQQFFGSTGKPPERITSPEVFAYAYGIGLSGREPSPVTIGARIACVSSFYRFLIRMGLVTANPCDAVERPRAQPSLPRGLSAEEIKRLLAAITTTPTGLRDRAIVLTLTLTGRRRSEVLNLKAGDITQYGGLFFYNYRGKGNKQGKRELPRPAFSAIERALATWRKSLASMNPGESLWPSSSPTANGHGLTSGTFYGNLQRYFRKAGLPPAGVHALRHSAAKLRRDAGESIEDISRFLDHSSLAVTTVYLRQLEGEEDRGWGRVAEAIGV